MQSIWTAVTPHLDTGRSIAIIVVAATGIVSTLWNFVVRPLRKRSFLAGQWEGELSDDQTLTLHCILVFFVKNGELAGSLFYEGNSSHLVKGFDQLKNNSDRLIATRSKDYWPIFCDIFEITMGRDIHFDWSTDQKPPLATVPETYRYRFEILRRIFKPRMRCSVDTRPDDNGDVRRLTGQFTKLRSG